MAKMILRYMQKCDRKVHWNVHTFEISKNYNFTSQCAVNSKDTSLKVTAFKFAIKPNWSGADFTRSLWYRITNIPVNFYGLLSIWKPLTCHALGIILNHSYEWSLWQFLFGVKCVYHLLSNEYQMEVPLTFVSKIHSVWPLGLPFSTGLILPVVFPWVVPRLSDFLLWVFQQ